VHPLLEEPISSAERNSAPLNGREMQSPFVQTFAHGFVTDAIFRPNAPGTGEAAHSLLDTLSTLCIYQEATGWDGVLFLGLQPCRFFLCVCFAMAFSFSCCIAHLFDLRRIWHSWLYRICQKSLDASIFHAWRVYCVVLSNLLMQCVMLSNWFPA
jgi:hypothetical protein